MHFLVYGEDNYRSRLTLASLRAKFLAARDATGMNVTRLRAGQAGLDQVSEALFSAPFLAEKKLVILEDWLKAPAADQEKITEFLGRLPDSTNAIFFEAAGPAELKKSPLLPLLAKEKYTVECPALDAAAAGRFVRDECRAAGADIQPRAVQTLTALLGTDSWRLHQEAGKLGAYAAGLAAGKGKPLITEAMVAEMVRGSQEESIFAFLDSCTAGRDREAIASLERLFDSGVPELQVVAMLLRQFRILLSVRDLMSRGERGQDAVARKLGLHPYPAGKAMAAAGRFSGEYLRDRYRELVEIDRAAKTGLGRPKVLLDVFAARLGASCAVR